MLEAEIFNYYGKLQVIESVFDADKNGLALTALKCRKFIGLSGSISFTFMAYNLLCLFREKVLSVLKLSHLGINEIVRHLMDIPAKVKKRGWLYKVDFSKESSIHIHKTNGGRRSRMTVYMQFRAKVKY